MSEAFRQGLINLDAAVQKVVPGMKSVIFEKLKKQPSVTVRFSKKETQGRGKDVPPTLLFVDGTINLDKLANDIIIACALDESLRLK